MTRGVVCGVVLGVLLVIGCGSVGQYVINKTDCESQGNSWVCDTTNPTDCKCVDRPIPTPEPQPIPEPTPTPVPQPEPRPDPIPVPTPEPVPAPTPTTHILQPGESVDLIVVGNSVKFAVRGLRMFNEPVDKDHILVFIEWMVDGKEVNVNVDMTNGKTRLITQDFGRSSGGRTFSENQDFNVVDWNSAETYTFTIAWTSTNAHMVAQDTQGAIVAQWDSVLWRQVGTPVTARVGSAYNPYDMPDVLEVTL